MLYNLIPVFLIGMFASGMSYGATIKGLNSKKSLVQIDEGSDNGIKKGTEICFFSKKNEEIVCAKVTGLKPDSAVVKIADQEAFKKLRKGLDAKYDASLANVAEEGATIKGPLAGAHRRNIKLLQNTALSYPAQVNKLGYTAPAAGSTVDSLWTSSGTQDLSFFGFGLEVEFPIGARFSLASGLRYQMIRGFSSIDNFTKTSGSLEYVETSQSFSDLGIWADMYLLEFPFGSKFAFRTGAGLDFDMNSATFSAEQKNDRDGQATIGKFATAESKLNIISLRVPIDFLVFFKPIGISFNPIVMLPLLQMGSTTASSTDTNARALGSKSAADDLKNALGHKKNSLALSIQIKTFWAF